MPAWAGRLLLATPSIEDGIFARSVVYLLEHDETGAMGVVVNRPMEAEIDHVLPDWVTSVSSPALLFHGGPVATDSALAVGVLADADHTPEGWLPMTDRVGLVDLDGEPPKGLVGLRVFAGYAGWSPGQLESELAEGSWLVVGSDPAEVFGRHPETLWADLVRRQPGDLRFWANLPDDPDLN